MEDARDIGDTEDSGTWGALGSWQSLGTQRNMGEHGDRERHSQVGMGLGDMEGTQQRHVGDWGETWLGQAGDMGNRHGDMDGDVGTWWAHGRCTLGHK